MIFPKLLYRQFSKAKLLQFLTWSLFVSCSGVNVTTRPNGVSPKPGQASSRPADSMPGEGSDATKSADNTQAPATLPKEKEVTQVPGPPPVVVTPTLPPLAPVLFPQAAMLRAGESIKFEVQKIEGLTPGFEFMILRSDDQVNVDLGTITQDGIYNAPALVTSDLSVTIVATSLDRADIKASAKINLLVPEKPFPADDGVSRGLVGLIYQTPGISSMPDFTQLNSPFKKIVVPNLNFNIGWQTPAEEAKRFQSAFFQNYPSLIESAAIQFTGKLIIPQSGSYIFSITSDDGAMLYLDDKLIGGQAGTQPLTKTTSLPIQLEEGERRIRVDYFNRKSSGDSNRLGLILSWIRPGGISTEEVIPNTAFRRPD
jgi:hypothetical protein